MLTLCCLRSTPCPSQDSSPLSEYLNSIGRCWREGGRRGEGRRGEGRRGEGRSAKKQAKPNQQHGRGTRCETRKKKKEHHRRCVGGVFGLRRVNVDHATVSGVVKLTPNRVDPGSFAISFSRTKACVPSIPTNNDYSCLTVFILKQVPTVCLTRVTPPLSSPTVWR